MCVKSSGAVGLKVKKKARSNLIITQMCQRWELKYMENYTRNINKNV